MARARNIKPGLFKNEILGVADPLYTLLFEGLWVLADRDGRLEDRHLRIKAETFPYRESLNVDIMLTWLADHGFIARYAADGKKFIQIIEFAKHQNPHKDERKSEIPAPDLHSASAMQEPGNTGACRADSLSPDSLFTDTPITPAPSGRGKKVPTDDANFDEAYSAYPKRPGCSKQDALKAWQARVKAGADPLAMIAGVKRYAAYVAASCTEPNYIKMPATFFGPGKHYEADWTAQPRASPNSKFQIGELDHSSSQAAMEQSMKRHGIEIPDGEIEI